MKKINIPYPERECPATGKKFVPKRENHVYLNRAVQVKHNNEQAKLNRQQLKELNDRIKSNEKKLAKLYDHMIRNNMTTLPAEYLDYEQIEFEAISSQTRNNKTKMIVKWCLDCGFEPVDSKMEYFIIHKKKWHEQSIQSAYQSGNVFRHNAGNGNYPA